MNSINLFLDTDRPGRAADAATGGSTPRRPGVESQFVHSLVVSAAAAVAAIGLLLVR